MSLPLLGCGPAGVGVAGPSGTWDFDQLASLRFWLRAQDLTGSDNDPIATLVDASGTGNDATQSTSGNRAILDTINTVNGYNCLEFQTANAHWYQWADVFSGFTAAAAIYVVKMNEDPPVSQFNGGGWLYLGTGGQANLLPFTSGFIYDGFTSNGRPAMVDPTPSLASWRMIYMDCATSGSLRCFIDDVSVYDVTLAVLGRSFAVNTSPVIGKQPEVGFYPNGRLVEMVILNAVPSTADRNRMFGRLAHKLALTPSLDGGHPYKSSPP